MKTEKNLQIIVPSITKKSLKAMAAGSGDSIRGIVLMSLAAAGIQVPEGELHDRRKAK